MRKWIGRGLIALVLLVVIVLALVYFYLDSIAKTAIERGGEYATGVDTTVNDVKLGILGGTFAMDGFVLANPAGYQSNHFLALADADVAVSLGSLRQDVVVVPTLHLDGVHLNLERRAGKQNFDVILENLEKLSSPETAPAPPDAEAQKWIVNDLRITNVVVNASGEGLLSDNQDVSFTIPEIALANVESDSLAELQGQVLKQVLAAIAKQAPGELLGAMGAELTGGLGRVGDLGEATVAKVGEVTAVAGRAAQKAGEALKEVGEKLPGDAGKVVGGAADKIGDVGDKAGDAVKDVGGAIGGILGGGKKKDEPEAKEGQ